MFKNIIAKEFLMTKKDVNGIIIKLEKNLYFMCLFEEGGGIFVQKKNWKVIHVSKC